MPGAAPGREKRLFARTRDRNGRRAVEGEVAPRPGQARGRRYFTKIHETGSQRGQRDSGLIPQGDFNGRFYEGFGIHSGEGRIGIVATNSVGLKKHWEEEYQLWSGRDLSHKRCVYFWVDGIYFNIRLADPGNDRQCILVIMGTLEDGTKELVAVSDGYRESKQSWQALLRELKERGLREGPKLAVGDGGLGFWAALPEEFPLTKEQHCWVHKTANILDKVPKSIQPRVKAHLREMYMAPTKEDSLKAYDRFLRHYEAKYEKACECLKKDKEVLFAFYDFPAEHWVHIRSINPIESTFTTVRRRTKRTKGSGSRLATLTMVFRLALEAQKSWKRIKTSGLLREDIERTEKIKRLLKKVKEVVNQAQEEIEGEDS